MLAVKKLLLESLLNYRLHGTTMKYEEVLRAFENMEKSRWIAGHMTGLRGQNAGMARSARSRCALTATVQDKRKSGRRSSPPCPDGLGHPVVQVWRQRTRTRWSMFLMCRFYRIHKCRSGRQRLSSHIYRTWTMVQPIHHTQHVHGLLELGWVGS